jgi:hypothetical protein
MARFRALSPRGVNANHGEFKDRGPVPDAKQTPGLESPAARESVTAKDGGRKADSRAGASPAILWLRITSVTQPAGTERGLAFKLADVMNPRTQEKRIAGDGSRTEEGPDGGKGGNRHPAIMGPDSNQSSLNLAACKIWDKKCAAIRN